MSKEIGDIIKRLERQREYIEEAILTLRRIDSDDSGESPSVGVSRRASKKATKKAAKKSTMSPEARERIAAAQRKRWAKQKKAAKKKA